MSLQHWQNKITHKMEHVLGVVLIHFVSFWRIKARMIRHTAIDYCCIKINLIDNSPRDNKVISILKRDISHQCVILPFVNEKIISSASAFYKIVRNDFCGAANPIVQSLLTSRAFRLSRKSSSALRSKPFNNKDLIFYQWQF
jgi:hypothetical protein